MLIDEQNKKFFGLVIIILCSLLLACPAWAGTIWQQRQKLTVSDSALFGFSVSINGDMAIIGSVVDDDHGFGSGSAYVFKREDESWSRQTKLLAGDGAAEDHFGESVFIYGNYVVVGAPLDDDKGTDSGSAYIFAPNNVDPNNWDQQQKLLVFDGAGDDHFGESVFINGNYVVVGAPLDDDKGTDSGSVYIFTPNNVDPNSWDQRQKLLASDGAADDRFGQSVSISADFIIVGAPGDDDSKGSAYIFKWDGSNWVEQQKFLASDGASVDQFGQSVSISGDCAIVGAFADDAYTGSAYIFAPNDIDPNHWDQQTKLTAIDGAAHDCFGWSVSISDDYCIVGTWDRSESGFVCIFERNGEGLGQQQKLLATTVGDWFGFSVSISGNFAIVGAPFDNSNSAYIFENVPCPTADLGGDCDVDFVDYALFAADFGLESRIIPRDAVVVDGNLSEWSGNIQWMDLDKICSGNPNDVNEAKFALQWDPNTNKIYAAVIVEDNDHVFLDEYVAWDASDKIEVYSQGDAAGGSGWSCVYDIAQQYMVAPDTSGGSWATWGCGQTIDANVGLEYAVIVNGDQIIYEVGVVPFDNYGGFSGGDTIVTDLEVGHLVGFDIVADTRWTDDFGMLSENLMTDKYNNADHIARYTLVENLENPVCSEPPSDIDRNCEVNFEDLAILVDQWLQDYN